MTIHREKEALRKKLLDRRRALTPAAVEATSMEIVRHLEALPPLREARCVGLYAPILQEVNPTALQRVLLARNVLMLYPRVVRTDDFPRLDFAEVRDPDDLQPGFRGIPEPQGAAVDPAALDVLLVPGVAFDPSGGRLGYGGGSYDELLLRLPAKTITVGLAHPFQLQPALPRAEHDRRVHGVVTPQGVHRCDEDEREDR